MPFAFQQNAHAERAKQHLEAWVQHVELVRKPSARERFARADFGWFASCVYPTADAQDLELVADWFALMFLYDDQLDDGDVGRNPELVNEINAAALGILMSPHAQAAAPAASGAARSPVVVSLADLWRRMDGRADDAWRSRFIGHIAHGAAAAHWEAQNRVAGIVPAEADYIEKRRHTGAIYVCMDLIDIVERILIPVDVYASRAFQAPLEAACDVVCWTNDLYSLEKEAALGEYHNLVMIVEHARGLSRADAVLHVAEQISARTRRFCELEPELLAAFPAHADELTKYLAGMRSWMRGNLDWSRSTKRYRELDRPAPQEAGGYLEAYVPGGSR
jgi:hypothetical protein